MIKITPHFTTRIAAWSILGACVLGNIFPRCASADEHAPELPDSQETKASGLLEDSKISISGWTEASYSISSADSSNLPLGFNYRADEFLLQQNWLRIERAVDADTNWGFRLDTILPGSDYRFTAARGLLNGQLYDDSGAPNRYGVDPVQMYVEGQLPDIAEGMDIKVGRFFAPYGVEAIDAVSTPMPSRSYAFIYNPFTETGVLTATKLTSSLTAQLGLSAGNDAFIDEVDRPTLIAGLKWNPPESQNAIALTSLLGASRYNRSEEFNNPSIVDLVYTHTSDPVTYNLELIGGFERDVPDIGTAKWFGVTNYLTYALNKTLSATGRVEVFDDEDGNRTGYSGVFVAPALSLNYQALTWLSIRPEVRYDRNNESRPFEGKNDLTSGTLDAIVKW